MPGQGAVISVFIGLLTKSFEEEIVILCCTNSQKGRPALWRGRNMPIIFFLGPDIDDANRVVNSNTGISDRDNISLRAEQKFVLTVQKDHVIQPLT